jgi:hypothetical protein
MMSVGGIYRSPVKRRANRRRTAAVRVILPVMGLLVLAFCFFFLFYAVDILQKHSRSFSLSSLTSEATLAMEKGARSDADNTISTARFVQKYLASTMNRTFLPLTAYLEPPLSNFKPLPLRIHSPNQLKKYSYSSIQSCSDIPNKLPVDHPIEWDEKFGPNVGQLWSLFPFRDDYARLFCPVDADPFLPWLHDVFPNVEGTHIEFVAHNRRRCRTSFSFIDDLNNLEPQVAIMQSVPIKRMTEEQVRRMAPKDLWNKESMSGLNSTRYRLASLEEADGDARETRFICQFHALVPSSDDSGVERRVLGETLSVFPYNYEHVNYRKGPKPHAMLTKPKDTQDKHGAHNEQVWNSILHFRCPIPLELQNSIRNGHSIVDRSPTWYVDLVPIRTHPRRTREGYCPQVSPSSFNPEEEWGQSHILPTVKASGRWANIPICATPDSGSSSTVRITELENDFRKKSRPRAASAGKKHYLIGCLWASAAFSTRGKGAEIDTSTSHRLREWLIWHLYLANFDHIYVYDNTEAHTNLTSLQSILDRFPSSRVSRIQWKHRICNNNKPNNHNSGERSSQYAAEASCRLRYGPSTEWLISFDTDEYLIPHGNWTDLQQWLKEGAIDEKTRILSLYQTRAAPNINFMEPFYGGQDSKVCGSTLEESVCLTKRNNASFLRAYDCEYTPLPKPDHGWRAQKQIYKPGFVLNHFVHYSTVTRRVLDAPDERSPPFIQFKPYERRVDELTEAFMLHTKTTPPSSTRHWGQSCREPTEGSKCSVGVPWPLKGGNNSSFNKDGLKYNCFQHSRIQTEFAVKLDRLMDEHTRIGHFT